LDRHFGGSIGVAPSQPKLEELRHEPTSPLPSVPTVGVSNLAPASNFLCACSGLRTVCAVVAKFILVRAERLYIKTSVACATGTIADQYPYVGVTSGRETEERLPSLYMVEEVELRATKWSPNQALGWPRGSNLWVLVGVSSFLSSVGCICVLMSIWASPRVSVPPPLGTNLLLL
jgi:hypothetical protein